MSTALIDPATMPLPGDEPELVKLTEMPAVLRERASLRAIIAAQAETIRELQRVVIGDLDRPALERLVAKREARIGELDDEVCDLAFKLARTVRERDAALGLVTALGEEARDECRRCHGHGVDLDDLTLGGGDEWNEPLSIEERIELHRDVHGYDPERCPEPSCWKGWNLGLDVPAELRRED